MNIYSIYDSKVEAYFPPFSARSDGEAERMVLITSQDPKSQFNTYPLDFKLVRIGSFDENTGKLCVCDPVDLGTVFYIQQVEKARYEQADKEFNDGNHNS